MKKKNFVLIIVALTAVSLFAVFLAKKGGDTGRFEVATEGAPAPDVTLVDAEGNPIKLSSLRGSAVIINFWATWCDSCRWEMPSLQRFFDKHRSKSDFRMLTVLFRDEPGRAAAYMKQSGFDLPVLTDPGGAASAAYGLTGVPETFLIDREGVLRKKIIGAADFDSPEASAFLRKFIEE